VTINDEINKDDVERSFNLQLAESQEEKTSHLPQRS